MFSYPVVYVDIETTGGSYRNSRVLEVAAIRVEGGIVTREFHSLLNPESSVPQMITRITGITDGDVVDAPLFEDIADELYEVMNGAVFIAHNVRFDYSFLKAEFAQLGMKFSPKLLCTVRLSRALYAAHRGHSLEKLIARHSIPFMQRHRALDDARAIMYFAQLAFDEKGEEQFGEAVALQMKTQSLPAHLDNDQVEGIPNVPGVYIFKDEHHQPIYVGKSVTLKKRVQSHFQSTAPGEVKMSQFVHHIETIPTTSEFTALILESRLVKELMPQFNRQLRRKSLYALLVRQDDEPYATLSIKSGMLDSDTDLSTIYGVYETRTKAKQRLLEICRTFSLCPKLLGLESGKGACFSYSLGKCNGACVGKEAPESYNRRVEIALQYARLESWPYSEPLVVPINEKGEQAVVNNWMVTGYIDEYGEYSKPAEAPTFDLDEYKIIRRFIREQASMLLPEKRLYE